VIKLEQIGSYISILVPVYMKFSTIITSFLTLILISCANGQTKQGSPNNQSGNDTTKHMDNFEYSLKTAHPNAQALMKEDFYWSPIEETGPFGNDDGWDAALGFHKWRLLNKTQSPIIYLKDLIASWHYPYFDWNEMDIVKIKEFITSRANIGEVEIQKQMQQFKEAMKNSADTSIKDMSDAQLRQIILSSSQHIGGSFLLGQDNAIIGTGFAQFALEGKVDSDLKVLTITAIKRQLLPVLIDRYDDSYRGKRKEQLMKMLAVISKASS
jgi:uncharacterized protein YfeS